MQFDPNSTVPHAHEVRVRARGVRLTPDGKGVQVSTRSDFIAPDLSAPSTTAIEQDKGLRGWSEGVAPVEVWQVRAAKAHADAKAKAFIADAMVGETVIRRTVKAPARRVLNAQGPAFRRTF